MNRALGYLWLALLKRRALHFLRGLRRPTTLLGFAALAFFLSWMFCLRREEVFGQLVRPASLVGGAMLMLGGSLFKGFLQRGLVFEPADVDFLFTSPFTQRQIVFYRLLPGYLFAVGQGLVFFAFFVSHLKTPIQTSVCLMLFQIVCFHLAAGAAIFAGSISEPLHHRIRWMMLGVYFVVAALYLRTAWDLKLIPAFVSSPLSQVFFYPAVTLSDIGAAPSISEWTLRLVKSSSFSTNHVLQPAFYLSVFAAGAMASLWLLLRFRGSIFETAVATTTRMAEKRLRLQEGRRITIAVDNPSRSAALPKASLFHGVGAIVWKNLVVASRSKRELVLGLVFTLIYTGFLFALRWLLHHQMALGGELPAREVRDFDRALAGLLCFLPFLLQRALSFDFRRDGQHLVGFRTLPVSSFALVLAELAVPIGLCLAFQAFGILVLMACARYEWSMLLLVLLGFPAVALALNGVWNLHYLLAASKRAGGKIESTSPVGILIVVALSFLVFFPAGWAALQVGRNLNWRFSELLAIAVWLAVQYLVDFLLLLALTKFFQRFEVSRDAC